MSDFTVLTLNTWKCDGDYLRRLPAMAQAIAQVSPDVILLQEVFASADGVWDTGVYLAEHLGLNRAYHPTRFKNREVCGKTTASYSGLAVLGKSLIRDHRVVSLPATRSDPYRWVQTLAVQLDGRSVRIGNTHLTHICDADELRLWQARKVVEFLHDDDPVRPTILGGDFNAAPDDPALQWLQTQNQIALKRAPVEAPTMHGGEKCIDHLLVTPPLTVLAAERVFENPDETGLLASDHCGVVAHLAFAED